MVAKGLETPPVNCNAMFKAVVFPAPGGSNMNTIGQNFIACTIVAYCSLNAMPPIAKMAASVLSPNTFGRASSNPSILPGFSDVMIFQLLVLSAMPAGDM